MRQSVLFAFATHLTSHFARSFSNHSYGYAFSNDQPKCFASYNANFESFMKYLGLRVVESHEGGKTPPV